MTKTEISELYKHMEWADALVWSAVLTHQQISVDTQIQEWLKHLHLVQRAFLQTWRQDPLEFPSLQFDDVRELKRWAQTYYSEVFAYLADVSDDVLAAEMPVPWAERVAARLGRQPESTTRTETALQVVFHSTYHRGQINARIRTLGGEPPLVDYIAWVWLGRDAATWPE